MSLTKLRAPLQIQSTKHCILAIGLVLLGGSSVTCAQSNFEEDFDDKEKSWQEISVQFPAAPLSENLLPFYVSPTATRSFAIDAKSLTVGTDGVIRYTLVTRSEAAAINISYEGIRCKSFEKKLYAFGHSDGSWSRSRHHEWEKINALAANPHHSVLAKDFFCRQNVVAGREKDILNRLRKQESLSSY